MQQKEIEHYQRNSQQHAESIKNIEQKHIQEL